MKYRLLAFPVIIVSCTLLGVAVGLGVANSRVAWRPWDGDPSGTVVVDATSIQNSPDLPSSEVEVAITEFDFGTMDMRDQQSHDFVFKNRGPGDLRLTIGRTTCKCVIPEIDRSIVPPGESCKVTVTWKGSDEVGDYHQTAMIETNDPNRRRVLLTIKGRTLEAVQAVPSSMVFDNISAGEPSVRDVSLYCFIDQPLEIGEIDFSSKSGAKHYGVEVLPLPKDLLAKEPLAKSGCLLRLTVKPGLPLGTFQQTIFLETNIESKPLVSVKVAGDIGRDIRVVGPGWNKKLGILMLGTIDSKKGAQRRLLLIARGPHHEELEFKSVRTVPEMLKVSLGKSVTMPHGRVTQTPLMIEVPRGSPRVNFLGSKRVGRVGQITIETTHPQIPQIIVRVRFAIEG